MTGATPYPAPFPLDNRHDEAGGHLQAVAATYDPYTFWRLSHLHHWTGAHVLDVGAGAGSVAWWLAGQVGPDGQVVATDLNPQHLPPAPQLMVIGHDLTGPTPLGDAVNNRLFDLIHCRLVLGHLPARRTILQQLAQMLAPGGILLVQDWAAWRNRPVVVDAPSDEDAQLYELYHATAGEIFDSAGTDPTWAPRIHRAMREEGLTDVDVKQFGGYWFGGGPGLQIIEAALPQLRPRLLDSMTGAQLDTLARLVRDERLVVDGNPLYSVSGRRL